MKYRIGITSFYKELRSASGAPFGYQEGTFCLEKLPPPLYNLFAQGDLFMGLIGSTDDNARMSMLQQH